VIEVVTTASAKPRKQRVLRRILVRVWPHKLMSVHLSSELREKYGRRSLPVRVGDTVKVLRGEYRGVTAKVVEVDRERQYVYLENVTRKRVDGTEVRVPVHISNVMIVQLDLSDEYRKTLLEKGREGLKAWKAAA
jgi:large subunit ribosomal protein L24